MPRVYYCDPDCPTDREITLRYLDQEDQKQFLLELVEKIKLNPNPDDRVRIAVSLVQHIPYDWESVKLSNLKNRYPYEVLFDKKGVCAEKSRLLAFLLRELGYGVVLLEYNQENHMAVGIKCPKEYSQLQFNNNYYCFVEAANPTIITDDQEEYVGVGKLKSTPKIIFICDGKTFKSVFEEYKDAREWIKINKLAEKNNNYLDRYHYNRWVYLTHKYGIEIKNN